MTLDEAKLLINRMINKKEQHEDYERVVNLSNLYRRLITGDEIDKLLIQFVQREDKEMFEQRCRLTKSITPAVANGIMNPFSKVTRNNKVYKDIGVANESEKAKVQTLIDGFYGSARNRNKGLDLFLRNVFVPYTFVDPNSWLIVQWDGSDVTKLPKVSPFIVSCEDAINFKIENDEVVWLFVKTEIKYVRDKGKESEKLIKGLKYCLYDTDITILYTQIDKDADLSDGQESIMIGSARFLVETFEPRVSMTPAFRIGYQKDISTNGRTFVSPLQPALPYFEKMVERVSELDLTMKLHTFPQKFQYVQKCQGESREKRCDGGKLVSGDECTACKGSGYKLHTSAQDAFLLPMPDIRDLEDSKLIDLNKLLTYKAPPTDIINIQREYMSELKADATKAVFNSDVFVQNSISKTATEKTLDYESVYDTLAPFASKYSELWVDVVTVICRILQNSKDTVIVHRFPTDLKLKTQSVLLAELEQINTSGAPSFIRDQVTQSLAETMYSDNDVEMIKYKVKHSFYPFNGKSTEEVQLALSSENVTRFDKVLYFNFEKIFAELERDDKMFWVLPYSKQWLLVGEKVNKIIGDLDEANADRFNVGDLTGADKTKGQGIDPNKGKEIGSNSSGNNNQ